MLPPSSPSMWPRFLRCRRARAVREGGPVPAARSEGISGAHECGFAEEEDMGKKPSLCYVFLEHRCPVCIVLRFCFIGQVLFLRPFSFRNGELPMPRKSSRTRLEGGYREMMGNEVTQPGRCAPDLQIVHCFEVHLQPRCTPNSRSL